MFPQPYICMLLCQSNLTYFMPVPDQLMIYKKKGYIIPAVLLINLATTELQTCNE